MAFKTSRRLKGKNQNGPGCGEEVEYYYME